MDAPAARDFAPFLADIAAAPRGRGTLVRIVRRPGPGEREIVDEARLDTVHGLEGDDWFTRGSSRTPDGSANPHSQVTLISTRVLRAIEPDQSRWPLAGDQLYVDFDLSIDALPAGSRIAVGEAVLVVSEQPHTGCAKFSDRFGVDALRWISTPEGKARRMRGMNTRVLVAGIVRAGDEVRAVGGRAG